MPFNRKHRIYAALRRFGKNRGKIERVFKDEEYRHKYRINKFPNNIFNKLVINCFDNPIEDNLDKLYKYVMRDGKFKIEEFILRSKI